MHWRIEDPRIWGPATPRQINTRVPQTRPGVSKWATRWEGPTQERSVPLASLALGAGNRPPPRRRAAAPMGPAAVRLWDPTPRATRPYGSWRKACKLRAASSNASRARSTPCVKQKSRAISLWSSSSCIM